MHALLSKLLKKRGIATKAELSIEEKENFDRWEKILSGGEITIEKLSMFCKAQVALIETQWKDLSNSAEKNQRLIIMHTVYTTILRAMTAPEVERASLEDYLTNLLK